uniref:Uncharacterized protein n=1 Tax=Panagrolaimus sp. PS1159 TaxID=55785 RepID=A0AC35FSG3_9BILA
MTTPKTHQRFSQWPPNTIDLPPTDSVYAQPYSHNHHHHYRPPPYAPPQLPSTSSSSGGEDFQPVKVIGIANINEKRNFTKAAKKSSKIRWYSNIIFNYPATVLFVTLLIFCVLPLTILQLFPLNLEQNPEKGFDTRGTEYSNARLTWTKLQPFLTQGSRVIIYQPPPPLEELKVIEPLKILEERQQLKTAENRSKRSFEDEIAALSSVACYEFELLQSKGGFLEKGNFWYICKTFLCK